jgi:hypothetical protein
MLSFGHLSFKRRVVDLGRQSVVWLDVLLIYLQDIDIQLLLILYLLSMVPYSFQLSQFGIQRLRKRKIDFENGL